MKDRVLPVFQPGHTSPLSDIQKKGTDLGVRLSGEGGLHGKRASRRLGEFLQQRLGYL